MVRSMHAMVCGEKLSVIVSFDGMDFSGGHGVDRMDRDAACRICHIECNPCSPSAQLSNPHSTAIFAGSSDSAGGAVVIGTAPRVL
jgi:hypothetical protein